MKTINLKLVLNLFQQSKIAGAAAMMALLPVSGFSQPKTLPSAAVLNIESKGLITDAETMGKMVQLTFEKMNVYGMLDMYDVSDILKKNNIDISTCLGKSCVVAAGKLLKVDKMITGSAEMFGGKIAITLTIIDMQTMEVEKTNTMEFLGLQQEIEKMVEITAKKMMGIEVKQADIDLLIAYDQPVAGAETQSNLGGPRIGCYQTFGEAGARFHAAKAAGGYNMSGVNSDFGYQNEVQYYSAGQFSALFEFIYLVGGLESGDIVPSFTAFLGFRVKHSWEFAIGPSFSLVQEANGYYTQKNPDGTPNENTWILGTPPSPEIPYIQNNLDSRGNFAISTGLAIAVGYTFHSGYLNIPINAFVVPKQTGTVVGLSTGFNIIKKHKKDNAGSSATSSNELNYK